MNDQDNKMRCPEVPPPPMRPQDCCGSQETPEAVNARLDADIILDKQMRRYLYILLLYLKMFRSSRERALAITKLQEAVMWLGMDLKRLNEARPTPVTQAATIRQQAMAAYDRYGAITDYKNFQGNPMPKFEDLPDTIKRAWEAAVTLPDATNPYPNSKDPSNTKVEPTADGLKL